MKRKAPVDLCLVDQDDDSPPTTITSPMTYLKRVKTQVDAQVICSMSPLLPSRVCTPSPPLSPISHSVSVGLKSIVRKSRRRTLVRYRDCKEIVDSDRDFSVASDYQILLFSHMVMERGRSPCFRCRLCPETDASTFYCQSVDELEHHLAAVEEHLMECSHAPVWLPQAIVESKRNHASQICPRKPYSHLVWKRILAHAIYSRVQYTKRITFAKTLHQERIIPGRRVYA